MHVTMLSSWGQRCGIARHSEWLAAALEALPGDEALRLTPVPAGFGAAPAAVYRAMGKALSGGDVAHVQHSYALFGGMRPHAGGWQQLLATLGRPLLVTLHELDLQPGNAGPLPPGLAPAYKRWFNRRAFLHPRIGRWMVHAAALAEQLRSLGAPGDRVCYHPLPLAPPPRESPDPAPLRRGLRLEGKTVLVMPGFLARRKGYEVALAALRLLPEETVLVAAGGEHAADRSGTQAWLEGEAERLGVRHRLRVTGWLEEEELEQAMALATVVLAPFHEMSASASLNFALARGRPLVATDLPELRDVEGLLRVPPRDPAALAAAVQRITASAELRAHLAAGAARHARLHGYPVLAERTRELYSELLAEHTARSRS